MGCGLGGTSRYLANTFGCNAVGVDLTAEYCHVAENCRRELDSAIKLRFGKGARSICRLQTLTSMSSGRSTFR